MGGRLESSAGERLSPSLRVLSAIRLVILRQAAQKLAMSSRGSVVGRNSAPLKAQWADSVDDVGRRVENGKSDGLVGEGQVQHSLRRVRIAVETWQSSVLVKRFVDLEIGEGDARRAM